MAAAPALQPFVSDGCTLFPNGTPGQHNLWCRCCAQHDLAYWAGGTAEQRVAADNALRECVNAVSGWPLLGTVMRSGVRVGGTPSFNTGFRWGYGWSDHRTYQPLTAAEQGMVERLLAEHSAAAEFDRVCTAPAQQTASSASATSASANDVKPTKPP